jgi:hypothetical protein
MVVHHQLASILGICAGDRRYVVQPACPADAAVAAAAVAAFPAALALAAAAAAELVPDEQHTCQSTGHR